MRAAIARIAGALFGVLAQPVAAVSAQDDLPQAQTVAYCDAVKNPRAFADKMIRVRALYQILFEQSAMNAPSCPDPAPATWVEFEKSWEARTSPQLRQAIRGVVPGARTDVVFVGRLRTGGNFGHLGMYAFKIEVYKVESVKPFGSFQPLP